MLSILTTHPYHGAEHRTFPPGLVQAPDGQHRQYDGFAGREVGDTVPPESDYGSPFFLSYAHARNGSSGGADRYTRRFFNDLSSNVAVQVSLPADVPVGYMDQTMQGGTEWTGELMRAAGTCQVLVALLSAAYLDSEWCGWEWWAFTQRTVRKRPGAKSHQSQGCIIPVLWAPLHSPLPEHISSRQLFSPDGEQDSRVAIQYRENGVFGLMRMGAPKNSYKIVAWRLAMLIAKIYHSQQVEPLEFDPADLHGCISG